MTDEFYALPDIGVLAIEGPDAAQFLQGQLSNDVRRLGLRQAQLTALHSVQGRVEALLRLLRATENLYLAVLPRELIDNVATTLRKRQFRARLSLRDASDEWPVCGALTPQADELHAPVDASGRSLVLGQRARTASGSRESWRALDIAAGVPQVYAPSRGEFVAQMLNLDLLGGVAFDKGCYIGQEIIARAHYRGRVKRRLQRFAHAAAVAPLPGDSIELAGGEAAQVVDSTRGSSAQELLAVARIGAPGALPLPYSLPAEDSTN